MNSSFGFCWECSPASSSENFWVALLTYSAEHFGEIAVAIATTFYVVFTYRLLENSEVQRKHSTEPYLTVSWYQAPEPTAIKLNALRLFAEKSRSLIEKFTSNPNDIDEANMATGDRYLILELSNARKTPIGWITLVVTGTLEMPDILMTRRLREILHLPNLQIVDSTKVEVTIVDLFPIPQSSQVTIKIEVVTYGTIDGDVVCDASSGDFQRSASGEFIPTESKSPQPYLAKKTGG